VPQPKTVVPRRQAQQDVDEAIDYYLREAGIAVATEFVDALEDAFAHIAMYPGTGSPRYAHELDAPRLRSWPLTRFPYLVFYVEGTSHVDVWRVLHAKRDLPAWLEELPE
jgi:toxin ParE1/3/4